MPKQKMSARLAAVEVLKQAGVPMNAKEITERVLADYQTGLKGKTPTATLGAQLYIAAKKGVLVKTAGKGMFALLDAEAVAETPEPEPAPEPETPAVQAEAPQVTPDPKPSQKRSRSKEAVAA